MADEHMPGLSDPAAPPCGEDPTPLPASPTPTMAYVPFQQWSSSLHSAERALDSGTLFPALDKPFYGGRREPR